MLKRSAIGLTLVIIALGFIFIGLDILDIAESYRLYIPIAPLNTIFISLVAVPITYLTAKNYMVDGSPEMLGLSCSAFAFGLCILIYGWLTCAGLNVRLTAYDNGIVLASVSHTIGMACGILRRRAGKSGVQIKPRIIFFPYLVILIIIAVVTWLALEGVISTTTTIIDGIAMRDIIQVAAAILCITSAIIFYNNFRKQHEDFYYWYFLGLILFAFGVLLISQGQLEGRVAWCGRASQYISGLYFLIGAGACWRKSMKRKTDRYH
jgi:hypothetical protein